MANEVARKLRKAMMPQGGAGLDTTLNAQGFRVLRFWHGDADRNPNGILEPIDHLLATGPQPAAHSALKTRVNAFMDGHPPPSGEGQA
jgi:hypothetical protein